MSIQGFIHEAAANSLSLRYYSSDSVMLNFLIQTTSQAPVQCIIYQHGTQQLEPCLNDDKRL